VATDRPRRAVAAAAAGIALLLAACASRPPEAYPGAGVMSSERGAPAVGRSPFDEPPGALFDAVTQGNLDKTICVPGWTATVRPPTSYTQTLKRTMLVRAGLPPADAIEYELDHFVPLAVGGHPRAEDNLWLQRWDGVWNARIKDRLERRLQVMVCAGQIDLLTARIAIQHDWHEAYRKYVAADPSAVPRGMELEEEEVVE